MKFKTNLHFHSQDDPEDTINYTFYEGINQAARLGFEILALTCHNKFIGSQEYQDYAASKNILLIPGIEQYIEGRHVVILNPQSDIEQITTFTELADYKKNHPEILIFAPHPYFYTNYSLKEKLEKNIHLFDVIEQSWFYSRWFNLNKKGQLMAEKYDLPFITASDTHVLKLLDVSYAIIEAKEKTIPAIFEAIKKKSFENVTLPRKFFKEMVWYAISQFILKIRKKKNK